MVQPDRNKFVLTYGETSVTFTPINWKEVEVVLSRDVFAVDQEVTPEISCFGEAASLVTQAYGAGETLTLTVQRLGNDWTYTDTWSFEADMQTYAKEGGIVTVGFNQNSLKDLIDKNKGTKYDIDIPSTYIMGYSGVTLDRSNEITAMGYKYPLESLSASNRIIAGVKSETSRSDSWIFTDHKGFYARALKANTITMTFILGDIRINFDGGTPDGDVKIYLLHARFSGTTITHKCMLLEKTHASRIPSASYTFEDYNEYSFSNDGTYWKRDGVTIGTASIQEGDFICLYAGAKGLNNAWQVIDGLKTVVRKPVLKIISSEVSPFVNYPVRVMPMETALGHVLNRMTGTTPSLVYNLPEYWDDSHWIPVLTSGSALQGMTRPKISISFDDIMQFLRCAYGASYSISGSTVTIDYIDEFYSSLKAMDVIPVRGVKIKRDTEHVFNKVEVGWETDDDVENGQFEPLCKNVFSIDADVDDKTLDLVSPFKGSPYTVEGYMRGKALESSKTRQQDNDVFVFCVNPFIGVTTTTLYREHLPASTLFNIPLTPMRMLIANGKYIGVSLYNRPKLLTFVSTDRTADGRFILDYEGAYVDEDNGSDTSLVAALGLALFKPEVVELMTCIKTPTKASIEAMKHKYFSAIDEKTDITYDFYINDVSLPLTVGKEQDWNGIRK